MSHYAGQGMVREPFSTSPDPNFLLATRQHATCLQELEISLRLRRGLNVVTGDIGTGKTTLCRSLLRIFAADAATDVHLLLDPHFETSEEFLRVILTSVSGLAPDPELGLWGLKEALKQQLFRLGMVEKRLVILVIDEGQKISPANLEILREMLNYETNTAKLLQIVIFGQRELEPTLAAMPNLTDRINVHRRLSPLRFGETRAMIRHRLTVASGGAAPRVRFTWPAVALIHLAGGGSPRKTVRLCHMALLEMLVRGHDHVGLAEARAAARPEPDASAIRATPRRRAGFAAMAAVCVLLGGLWFSLGGHGPVLGQSGIAIGQVAAPAGMPEAVPAAAAVAQPQPLGADLNTRGVSLRPEETQSPAGASGRVTLQPVRDMGPAVRIKVDTTASPLLQVQTHALPPATTGEAALARQTGLRADNQ
ncbi:MAG: hypothetical protein AUJ49_09810 [Desulfovibrionaceae bacterium CG1_02_65_16]|nr:MAG: hypothetical protein AUJ49_09810 [Desulfovibrionaceae bacterium CG1_02_65_16]